MRYNFNILDLNSVEARQMVQNLDGSGGITLFVGSAISIWYPTLSPPGKKVTNYLATLLVEQFDIFDESEKNEIIEAITATPFEYIWDRAPQHPLLTKEVADEYKYRPPNAVHQAIRNLISSGLVQHVITTNYDTCLDQLFGDVEGIQRVVSEKDAKKIEGRHIYFKIHGTAEDGLESSIVYRLSHEGILPDWKRQVLKHCISNSVLLVVGYSGLDFEICPEIKLAKPAQIIWNSLFNPNTDDRALTPNALRVLQSQSDNIAVWGDMKKLFSLLGQPIPDLPIRKASPSWKLDTILTKTEIQIWACSIISPLGYGLQAQKLAQKILDSIDNKSQYYATAIYLLGDSLFHKGKYVQCAESCAKASLMYQENNDWAGYILSISRQADAQRCNGDFWNALLVLHTAKSKISALKHPKREKQRYLNILELKELLVYRDFFEIARWLNNSRLARYYQLYSKTLISRIAKVSAKEGQWDILQQVKMWAGRLNIDFNKVYQETMQPLDDWFGFRHLGAIIPQMMAARDALWRNTAGKVTTRAEVQNLIKRAEKIECYPEIWKLSLAFNERFAIPNNEPEIEWEKAFYECEYTDFLRKFKLANPRHR